MSVQDLRVLALHFAHLRLGMSKSTGFASGVPLAGCSGCWGNVFEIQSCPWNPWPWTTSKVTTPATQQDGLMKMQWGYSRNWPKEAMLDFFQWGVETGRLPAVGP